VFVRVPPVVSTPSVPAAGTAIEYHKLFTVPVLQQLATGNGASSVAQLLSSLMVTPEVRGIAPPQASFAIVPDEVVKE
jgi:hypothetical protein